MVEFYTLHHILCSNSLCCDIYHHTFLGRFLKIQKQILQEFKKILQESHNIATMAKHCDFMVHHGIVNKK